ncbi:MAG: glycosyl hydrolase, partial [Ginsengibacter sp.]
FFSFFICVIALTYCADGQSVNNDYTTIKNGFLNPPHLARPKVYWWCLNGNIDTIRAKQELSDLKKQGFGGFDFFEIGVPKSDSMVKAGPAFLSNQSLKIIKSVVNEAKKLGLEMGLNLASSWNAGGSWTLPKNAGKSLYYSDIIVKGGQGNQDIKVPFPSIKFPKSALIGGTGKSLIPFGKDGKPEYYEEVAVLAIPANIAKGTLDTSKIINVSRYFDSRNDLLKWNPPAGEWKICRYICSNSGQQLVLPSPHSAGLTIDHFDSVAVRTHLMYIINRLQSVLGDLRKTPLKTFYLASYEARGLVWTSTLPAEFKKINGYQIAKYLPSFFDHDIFSKETYEKVQSDFRKTLSELMINNLYRQSGKICHKYGLEINCEAGGPGYPLYNGPAEPLKALGSLDIPRGEFWVNKDPEYYKDNNGKTIPLFPVVKEVAAASHIYHKKLVEQESFTSFQHWQAGPYDLKPFADEAFCEGMNRLVFHGFSHSPEGTGYPGYVYHAGTHFNDKNPWFSKINPFVNYLSRISYVAQSSKFVSDVVFYYGDRIPNAGTPKNTHFVVGPGYDYEIINTDILLNDLKVRNGKLVLSNGEEFNMLALENEPAMNPFVLKKLNSLIKQGAVIIGPKPERILEVKDEPFSADEGTELIDKLWQTVDNKASIGLGKDGKIYSGIEPAEVLKDLHVSPDFNYQDNSSWLLDYIHYRKASTDFYFIRNTSDKWVSKVCGFRRVSAVPEIWDPVSGKITSVPVYEQKGEYLEMPLTLSPHQALFVVLKKGYQNHHYTEASTVNGEVPRISYTDKGVEFMDNGIFNLAKGSNTQKIKNEIEEMKIGGPWSVTFTKGWGAPQSATFPKLISWTDSPDNGIKYYSGNAVYKNSFTYSSDPNNLKGKRLYLDLGEISKVASVWLNGEYLGITWAYPYRIDVTNKVRKGENSLKIEVANTWSNRIVGDALEDQHFTNTNIKYSSGRVPWDKTPLIKSGLLGPVTLQAVEIATK